MSSIPYYDGQELVSALFARAAILSTPVQPGQILAAGGFHFLDAEN